MTSGEQAWHDILKYPRGAARKGHAERVYELQFSLQSWSIVDLRRAAGHADSAVSSAIWKSRAVINVCDSVVIVEGTAQGRKERQ